MPAALDLDDLSDLVLSVARGMKARLPQHWDWRDLIGPGAIAMLRAARRYDPRKCGRPATYFLPRIRWAMIDELRSTWWRPLQTLGEQDAEVKARGLKPAVDLEEFEALIRSLTDFQQQVLREQYIEDLDAAEAAARHGVTKWVIWKHRRKARDALRLCWGYRYGRGENNAEGTP